MTCKRLPTPELNNCKKECVPERLNTKLVILFLTCISFFPIKIDVISVLCVCLDWGVQAFKKKLKVCTISKKVDKR